MLPLCRSILRLALTPDACSGLAALPPERRPDAVVWDFEAVPPNDKSAARARLEAAAAQFPRPGVHVRIAGSHSPWLRADLEAALSLGVSCIHVPRVSSRDDIRAIDHKVEELCERWALELVDFAILICVDNPRAVLEALPLASSSTWVAGFVLDGPRLTAHLGLSRTSQGDELDYVRQSLALTAAAQGLVVIDAAHAGVAVEDCEREARRSRRLGLHGKLVDNVDHCFLVNRAFTPTAADLEQASEIVAAVARERAESDQPASIPHLPADVAAETVARRVLLWAKAAQDR